MYRQTTSPLCLAIILVLLSVLSLASIFAYIRTQQRRRQRVADAVESNRVRRIRTKMGTEQQPQQLLIRPAEVQESVTGPAIWIPPAPISPPRTTSSIIKIYV